MAKDYADLEQIQRRVLWLATRMIDYANNERPNVDGIKVGAYLLVDMAHFSGLVAGGTYRIRGGALGGTFLCSW